MVEVPAAALKAQAFAPHVDFFSIGTNDLTQYALAAERGNAAVADVGDPLRPRCAAARGSRVPHAACLVAVCGELAADEQAAALLVGLGVRELSVTPRAVPAIKQRVPRPRRRAGRDPRRGRVGGRRRRRRAAPRRLTSAQLRWRFADFACPVAFGAPSAAADSRSSSRWMTCRTALMSARWVNAWGKLPRCWPLCGSISSA